MRTSPKLCCLATIVALLISSIAFAGPAPIKGRLETIQGVQVLTLWGSDHERGYAHGYLLAEEIVGFAGQALLDPRVLDSKEAYGAKIVKEVLPTMAFSPQHQQELEGMLAGIIARLRTEDAVSKELGREIRLDDLKALNCLADWYSFYCSSFSVWGELHDAGQIATARNLDFLRLPGLIEQQLVIVHKPDASNRRKWVSVGWTGLIGCYTGMNEEGVTVSMHDCPPGPRSAVTGFVPRSLALRDAIEGASAATAIDDVEKILRKRPAMFGNNVHVSSPFTGQETPAAVFEYDPDTGLDGGVTRGTDAYYPLIPLAAGEPDVKGRPAAAGLRSALVCTNHYRSRTSPLICPRFAALSAGLIAGLRPKAIDLKSAMGLLSRVSVSDERVITAHAVYMLPNAKEFFVSFADSQRAAPNDRIMHFKLADLLSK